MDSFLGGSEPFTASQEVLAAPKYILPQFLQLNHLLLLLLIAPVGLSLGDGAVLGDLYFPPEHHVRLLIVLYAL